MSDKYYIVFSRHKYDPECDVALGLVIGTETEAKAKCEELKQSIKGQFDSKNTVFYLEEISLL